ncbi:hypothetical protein HYH02_007252 [Chlamydomonas schloesseri]|uniref:SET domain-containing protein n=1 Tax=Chlamydomonas schloesseri TaxID=2026947 RepID=A0A835WIY8_9CHLO|nr:hypothetical protein HYH02_007252 [Chlamydomonas schloesseri]|eukprot:KAG2447795.1 hypothetical protein HYH02_007252 [Chlamydomonas schloesseri]
MDLKSRFRGLGLFVAVLALASVLGRGTDAYITNEEQSFLDWVISEGGELRVTIGRDAKGVRGLYTKQPVKKGEVLISIPEHLVLSVKNAAAAEATPQLLREVYSPCSRLRPYLDTLPGPDGVLTAYNWPDEYVKYLADPVMEEQVTNSFKLHAKYTWLGNNDEEMEVTIPEAIGRANISLADWEHMVSLLSSRTFTIRKGALSLVPVLDLANHDVRDVNQLDNSSKVRLIAGKDLGAGEEVTITYGGLRNDELLLYYGFLDTVTEPPRLFSMDHRAYKLYEAKQLSDAPMEGTPEELRAELARLRGVLAALEERLAALGPIPQTRPYVASVLASTHDVRRRALHAEIGRVERKLQEGSNGSGGEEL